MGLSDAEPLQGFGGLFDSWHYDFFWGEACSGLRPIFLFWQSVVT
jgi:hypothetical protein